MALDPRAIRQEFPLLDQSIDGHPLVYLDSAATSQKPLAVLDAMDHFYRRDNANAHRGMHVLAERATVAYEDARRAVARFIGAKRPEEIVFTRNGTEAINVIAKSWARSALKRGDCVALTVLEHHSNVVPWLQLREEIGIDLAWIDIDDGGQPTMDAYNDALGKGNVKLVTVTAQSNVLGTRPPLDEMIRIAHAHGALVLVDAAQMIAHAPINVTELECDFLAFSGHKVYGPTGIGVLYGKQEILQAMPPFLGGGMMIQDVRKDGFTPADIPARFEAGTQPIAEAVGLRAAIEWLEQFDWSDLAAQEHDLIERAYEQLRPIKGLRILGPQDSNDAHGCVSFVIDGIHAHDLTEILGRQGICLRAGHHCAQPLHARLGVPASSRVSVGIYTTRREMEIFGRSLGSAVATWRIA